MNSLNGRDDAIDAWRQRSRGLAHEAIVQVTPALGQGISRAALCACAASSARLGATVDEVVQIRPIQPGALGTRAYKGSSILRIGTLTVWRSASIAGEVDEHVNTISSAPASAASCESVTIA